MSSRAGPVPAEPDLSRPRTPLYTWAALALFTFLAAANVYRAATQSITIDEAFSYRKHIANPRFWQFEVYTANNHVLNTVLAKLTTGIFGLSELTLRLPSLAGGLLYFAALFRLAGILFGGSPWFLLFVALNSLNPGILDFLSAARGYGMGLGFLLWGLVYLLEGRAVRTGLALGLSVASQLTYAIPAAAIGAVFLFRHSRDWRNALRLLLPAAATAGGILAWPVRHATLGDFYVGQPSLRDTLRTLMDLSFYYQPTALHQLRWFPALFTGLLLAGIAAAAVCALRTRHRQALELLGVLAGSLALLAALRLFLPRPFPEGRTALYFFPLTSAACLLPLHAIQWRPFQAAGAAFVCACLAHFALEFNLSSYAVYRAGAGVKRVFQALEAEHRKQPRTLRAGASWELSEGLNFYRMMRRAGWLEPVTRDGPDCYFDYYVLMPKDRALMARYELEVVYRDAATGVSLARPSHAALRRLAAVYPPPLQTTPPCRTAPDRLSPFIRMGDPAAELHLVQDVETGPSAGARWTYERPILVFRPVKSPNSRFLARIRLTRDLFPPGAGPLSVSLSINGHPLARQSFTEPGDYTLSTPVSEGCLGSYLVAAAEMRSSRHFTPPDDDARLGFQLLEAGFAPAGR